MYSLSYGTTPIRCAEIGVFKKTLLWILMSEETFCVTNPTPEAYYSVVRKHCCKIEDKQIRCMLVIKRAPHPPPHRPTPPLACKKKFTWKAAAKQVCGYLISTK